MTAEAKYRPTGRERPLRPSSGRPPEAAGLTVIGGEDYPLIYGLAAGAFDAGCASVILDCGCRINPYVLARVAKARGLDPVGLLSSVRTARAFTVFQLLALIEELERIVMDERSGMPAAPSHPIPPAEPFGPMPPDGPPAPDEAPPLAMIAVTSLGVLLQTDDLPQDTLAAVRGKTLRRLRNLARRLGTDAHRAGREPPAVIVTGMGREPGAGDLNGPAVGGC